MLYELRALQRELPALRELELGTLCEKLPSLGFPVDGVARQADATVLDVDVTANRADVLSHRGLARDLAASLGVALPPLEDALLAEGDALFPIRLEAPACPYYATAILELGSGPGTAPEASALLGALGSSSKQLPAVDASNELLQRYGHPTHAFDADTLQGAVVVRFARSGETLVTLDGLERKLTEEDLVIADEVRPIALAGVMGGEATKVTASTSRVLLESAYFEPRLVRRMAHRHGLHTEASHRFGRGADPAMVPVARNLLCRRLEEWAGARLLGAWSLGCLPTAGAPILLAEPTLTRIAGESISLDEAASHLERLGCGVSRNGEALSVCPPSWRHDLSIEEDLAEEVLRLRGYEGIGSALPPLQGHPMPLSADYRQVRSLARRMAHLGFHQTVTLGFISPEMDASAAGPDNPPGGRTLGNPLGLEYSVMRSSLLPSLSSVAELNRRQGAKSVRLFEIAPVYRSAPGGPREEVALAFVWGGTLGGEDFLTRARPIQAADLLGVLKDLGALESKTVQELGEGLLGLEVGLTALPQSQDRIIPAFTPFSRFPMVERDLSLLVDLIQSYSELDQAMASALRLAAGPAFRELRCVDVFRHKSLPEGRQALLMRMVFQASDRTLTSEAVDGWVETALQAAQALGAERRG